jgi:hypothetical protein
MKPPTQCTLSSYLWVKRPRYDLASRLPLMPRFKNEWVYASIPPIYLHGVDREHFSITHQTSENLLYVFFWVIPRSLNFISRRFETLYLFHLHRQEGEGEDGTDTVFRNVGL